MSANLTEPLSSYRNVGVWAPGPIGDLVMATPAFAAVQSAFPDARRVVYAGAPSTELLAGSSWFQQVVSRSRDVGAMVSQLRRERHDLMLLFTGSFRSAWIAWRGRVSHRVGYAAGGRSLLLSHPVLRTRGRHSQDPAPMVDTYLELLRDIGVHAPETGAVTLSVTPDEAAEASRRLASSAPGFDRLVAVSPGAAYGPAKRWPAGRFAAVIRELLDAPDLGVRVVMLFAPGEATLVREITNAVGDTGGRLLADHVPLGPTKGILAHAALHITCDTGSRHIGHAVGTPTLSILGPTHPEWSAYPGQVGEVLRVDVPCGPCMKRQCVIQSHDCMVDIEVDRVVRAARRVLCGTDQPVEGRGT